MRAGKRLGVTLVRMPSIVGGRYSVATEVGLVPLALLDHDTDSYIAGVLDSTVDEFESLVADNAVRLHHYMQRTSLTTTSLLLKNASRNLGLGIDSSLLKALVKN